jgi:agmatinase
MTEELDGLSEGGELDPEVFATYVPYQGLVTFAKLDWTRELDDVDLAVYGMPMDLGTTFRPGARFGPRAIREASMFVGAVGVMPPHDKSRYEDMTAVDYGDIPFTPGSIESFLESTRDHVGQILAAGASPLGLGGDHFCAYPEILACAEKYGEGLSIVHFDAHADDYNLPGLNHGNMHYKLAEEGIVDPTKSAMVAIRHSMPAHDYHVIDGFRCGHMTGDAIANEIRDVVGDNPVFVTLDIDGMDPSVTPGTGTPYPGGITSLQQREILFGMKGMNVVGADVVEVSPHYDSTGVTAIVAAAVAIDLGVMLLEARLQHGIGS